jgi:hypothetical protein
MVYPSAQLSDSVLDAEVRELDVGSDAPENDTSPEPRLSENDVSSPVCAACWAY